MQSFSKGRYQFDLVEGIHVVSDEEQKLNLTQ